MAVFRLIKNIFTAGKVYKKGMVVLYDILTKTSKYFNIWQYYVRKTNRFTISDYNNNKKDEHISYRNKNKILPFYMM